MLPQMCSAVKLLEGRGRRARAVAVAVGGGLSVVQHKLLLLLQ